MTSFNVPTSNSPDLDINISRYLSSTPYVTLTDIYKPNVGVENHCTRVKILTLIFSMQTPMYRGLSTSITLRQALYTVEFCRIFLQLSLADWDVQPVGNKFSSCTN